MFVSCGANGISNDTMSFLDVDSGLRDKNRVVVEVDAGAGAGSNDTEHVVATHPLFAAFFQDVGVDYPEFAKLRGAEGN